MINDAMEFAAKAHEGQFRKGTRRPYIVHPIEVADIVSTMTKDEEVICAAVLHDTIEDCRGITWDVLRLRFGSRVADMVSQESEDKSKTWEERKGATVSRLKDAPIEVQMIGLADKLSNMWILTEIIRRRGMPSGRGSACRANQRLPGITRASGMFWRSASRACRHMRSTAGWSIRISDRARPIRTG